MIYCPNCGKPRDHHNTNTLTTSNSVWPYCQCGLVFPATITIAGGTTYTGWASLKQPVQEVPQAFQDAFQDGELEV